MNMKEIALASPGATQDLLVPEGTIATYDVAQGPLSALRLVNNGTIRLISSEPELTTAEIIAQSLSNVGAIESEVPTLRISTAALKAREGSFTAPQHIEAHSESDLHISGGTFRSEILQLTAAGKAAIHADRIDAKVHVKACELAIGVRRGDLHVAEQHLTGDPLYYNGGGSLNITVPATQGDDLSCFATGDITIGGTIDTRGGDENHYGRVTLVSGCTEVTYNDVPNNEGMFECTDCSLPQPGLVVVFPPEPAGNITVGNVLAKGFSASGAVVNVNGTITVDNENIPVELNLTGGCQLFGSTSVTIGGLVTVVARHQNGDVNKGQLTVGAGENITIGNVDGSISANTTKSGAIVVGNVDAGTIGLIHIDAGGDFGDCGGGFAPAGFTDITATIQTGNLRTPSGVRLRANGNIGTGTITLPPNTFPGLPHDVRIHANIGKETAAPFLAGGAGSNGCSTVTVTNRNVLLTDEKAGVVAISNGNGDIHANGNRLRCITGDKGTPGIVLDAGTGQVRLVGGNPLSVDGDATNEAGFIIIMGGELRAPGAASISASDTKGTAEEEAPTVIIAVNRIELPGSLMVNCNGHTGTSVKLVPKGSIDMNLICIGYTEAIKPQGVSPTVEELRIAGAGSLTVTAHSENGSILCSGDPLRFNNNGATLLESERDGSSITLQLAGGPSGQDSLIFAGGSVELSVDNQDGDAGSISVSADRVKNTATGVSMHANALGQDDAGSISLDIDRGNLALGTATGTMSLAATAINGNGGTITVENAQHNGTITLDPTFSAATVNVSALGGDGDGGTIDLHADHLVNNAQGGNSGLVSNGAGSGKGGHISLRLTDDITIGGAPGLVITAISTGSGNGGDVDIVSTRSNLVIDAGSINVSGGSDGRGGNITAKTLQTGTTLTINGSLMANGQNTRRGGNIKVLAAGLLDISMAQFHADGGPRGAGGTVEISAGADLTIQDGQVSALAGTLGNNKGGEISITTSGTGDLTVHSDLNVNGAGNAEGGLLTLTSAGKLDVTESLLLAKGGSDGNGGTVQLSAVAELFAAGIDVSGGTGDGGNIAIESQDAIAIAEGTPTLALLQTAALNASSDGSGNGGTINLDAGANLSIDGVEIRANAGPDGDGNGGTITHTANQSMMLIANVHADGGGQGKGGTVTLTSSNGAFNISTEGAKVTADGGQNGGAGGRITVLAATRMDLSAVQALTFSAQGKDSGAGGFVWLNNIGNFDVLQVINVDAGTNAAWNIEEGLGSIRLNDVTCRQWKIDGVSRTWPKRYWLARGDTSPSNLDKAPMNLAVSSRCDHFRNQFGLNKAEIFVFPGATEYGGFTGRVLSGAAQGGSTFNDLLPGHQPTQYIYCNPWESGSVGGGAPHNPYSEIEYREVAAHEFGHVYDICNGLTSDDAPWLTAKQNDINTINGATPCDASTGPFRAVFDLNRGQDVCDGTTLRPDYTGAANNFAICATLLDPAFAADPELHAQMFGYALVGNAGGRPMFDKIVDNGYFAQLLAIARTQSGT